MNKVINLSSQMEEIIISICKQYNWPYKIDSDNIIFEVALTNDRTQACSATLVTTRFGQCVHVQSPIGKLNEVNLANIAKQIFRLQYDMVYSRLSVIDVQNEETIILLARTLVNIINENELFNMIQEVAITADSLENDLFQKDEF